MHSVFSCLSAVVARVDLDNPAEWRVQGDSFAIKIFYHVVCTLKICYLCATTMFCRPSIYDMRAMLQVWLVTEMPGKQFKTSAINCV